MLVAAEPVLGAEVVGALREHLGEDAGDATLLVVAPSLADSAVKHAMGDVDEGQARAQDVLTTSLNELERIGASLEGRIGDADPMLAVDDALAEFPAGEIIVITGPEGEGMYLEDEVFDRTRKRFGDRVVHLTVGDPGSVAAHVEAVERPHGRPRGGEPEIDSDSKNLPRLSIRDIGGIGVAAVGTIVLIALAAQCGGDEVQRDVGTGGVGSSGSCVFRYVVAGGMALINIAHIVGLVLFQSVGYRGIVSKAFAWASLIGTPVAIVLSLLIH